MSRFRRDIRKAHAIPDSEALKETLKWPHQPSKS